MPQITKLSVVDFRYAIVVVFNVKLRQQMVTGQPGPEQAGCLQGFEVVSELRKDSKGAEAVRSGWR